MSNLISTLFCVRGHSEKRKWEMDAYNNNSYSPVAGADPRFSIHRILLTNYRYTYELLVDDIVVDSDSRYRFLARKAKTNEAAYLALVNEQKEK